MHRWCLLPGAAAILWQTTYPRSLCTPQCGTLDGRYFRLTNRYSESEPHLLVSLHMLALRCLHLQISAREQRPIPTHTHTHTHTQRKPALSRHTRLKRVAAPLRLIWALPIMSPCSSVLELVRWDVGVMRVKAIDTHSTGWLQLAVEVSWGVKQVLA